jgi:hypothetical protein
MLDDDTLKIPLVPGIMPGTEITLELPVIQVMPVQPLPAHLANDPILTMPAPKATHPSLFDHTFGDRPTYYPARPHKAPRVPVRPRDHLLAALGGGVILLSVATVVLVESGFNSGLPQSEQERLNPPTAVSAPADPGISQGPVIPAMPSASPSHIPHHIRQAPPAPVSRPSRVLAVPTHSQVPSTPHSASPSPSSASPSPSSPSPSPSTPAPSTTPSTPAPFLPVVLPTLPHPTTHSSSPITPSP